MQGTAFFCAILLHNTNSRVTFIRIIRFDTKIMKQFILVFFIFPLATFAQVNEGLTAEERAYLFHIVKKSPILDNSIGRYFDYKGPSIVFQNKEIHYDSIELLIINQPELLLIRREEIAKSPKGIIAEAANKMAIWELNKVLLAKRGSEKDLEAYQEKYAVFEKLLLGNLPFNAQKEKDGVFIPHPKLLSLLNPSLSLDDKVALLESLRFLDPKESLKTLEAINTAINQYVENRSLEVYRSLGGKALVYKNVLVAAGDGSSTSGLLEEREKDEKGRWNRGLPKAVGLFPYQLKLIETLPKKTEKVAPLMFTTSDFETVGNNRLTNLHFDVWGYNSKKQTTVVIEKNGLSYHLFGAGDTRFLSPDSTFSEGTTFQFTIQDLEKNKIAKLQDKITGKRGFDYWIAYYKKKKDETVLKIEINEKKYSDLSYNPITTNKKAPRNVRKAKKRARKNNGGPVDYQPTQKSGKKEKRKSQQEIVTLYSQYEGYKRKISELEKEKKEAQDLLAIYQQRLDYFKRTMGYKWATYTEKDGLYTFQDSSTFDLTTQEFQFPASLKKEGFEVRLIAIPESSLSQQADEVMVHINLVDAEPNFSARLQVELEDVFGSDSWELNTNLLKASDSVALVQFFEGLLDKKVNFSIVARGQGIGQFDGCRVVKNPLPVEQISYPGATASERNASKMDSTYARLRRTELFIHLSREILLEINSYTDPVASSIEIRNPDWIELMEKYKLTKNDLLSAFRSAEILNHFKEEINVAAGTYLSRENAKIVIDRFNKEWMKTKISVGKTSLKLSEILVGN